MSIKDYTTANFSKNDVFSCTFFKSFSLLILLLVMVSCTTSTNKKNSISLMLVASSDLNPDMNGRASPLALTIYQLKTSSVFKKTDYISLSENSKSVLGGELITVSTVTINPGQTLKLNYPIAEGEGAFGVVAGYRVIDNSIWQLIYEYPRTKAGIFSKLKAPIIYSHRVLLDKNKMHFESAVKEH